MSDDNEMTDSSDEEAAPNSELPAGEKIQGKRAKVYKDDEELDDTIFIRNVARFDTTQESLKAHMEANWGETVYCLICKDRETGESKGTAFVKFNNAESAGACLGDFEDRDMQQKFFLDGRNLFVLPALNRNQMGEVKKASAKKEDTPKEQKVKKPRWYRPPVHKDSSNPSSESTKLPFKKPDKPKDKKGHMRPDKRTRRDQMAGKSPGRSVTRSKGSGKPHPKSSKGKQPQVKNRRQSESKGISQKSQMKHKKSKKAGSTDKKMKKAKKVKRKS